MLIKTGFGGGETGSTRA